MSRETLKSLEALFEPDHRMANTVIRDIRTPESSTPYTIVEHYKRHADLRLTAVVPDEVANSWTAAQSLAIYGFYVYQFIPMALHQALTTLELALRLRLNRDDNPGLKKLLHQGASRKLFDKDALLAVNRLPPWALLDRSGGEEYTGETYWPVIVDGLTYMRNTFAHGTHMLFPDVLVMLDIVHRLIQQAYAPRSEGRHPG